jgi:hypothetical protein
MKNLIRQHKTVLCPLCLREHTAHRTFSYQPGDFIPKWTAEIEQWRGKNEFCDKCSRRLKGQK